MPLMTVPVLYVAFLVLFTMLLNQKSNTSVLHEAREATMSSKAVKSSPQKRIIVASYLFGEKSANTGYLQMFLESARHSGIDVAIVGFPKPGFPLPPNVKHINVTWDQFVDRVSTRLFNGENLPILRRC